MSEIKSLETLASAEKQCRKAIRDVLTFGNLLIEAEASREATNSLVSKLADKRLTEIAETVRDHPHHYGLGCGYRDGEDLHAISAANVNGQHDSTPAGWDSV